MRNYQKELAQLLPDSAGKRLLLHSCCGPCSSYVLEYLSAYFDITLLYYNPNITEPAEYELRLAAQKLLLARMPFARPVQFLEGVWDPEAFRAAIHGLENVPEGRERCRVCFHLRLERAAQAAAEGNFDYYTTTLSVSPHKNAHTLMEIGEALSTEYGIPYLPSDFKKRGGYQRSVVLAREYQLYRQDYCGCPFSKRQ